MNPDEHPPLPAHLGPLSDVSAMPLETLPPPAAASGAAAAKLDVGQLDALDTMMQAFLADGELTPSELQAYQTARAGFLGVDASQDAAPGPSPLADDGHTTAHEAVAAYQETKPERGYTPLPLAPAHEVHQDPQMTPTEAARSQTASPANRPLQPIMPVVRVGPVDRI